MPAQTATLPDRPAPTVWLRVRKWIVPLLAVIVLGLLLSHVNKVDWSGAWHALRRYSPWLLLAVLAISTASHALYGCYDLIGRRHTHHRLPWWRTWAIAVASYAFNLNLGSLVGGVALRARLYAKAGLDETTVAQVVGLSLATNWLGYGALAGALFAAGVIVPPRSTHLDETTFRLIGAGMVLLAVAYVVACALARGRTWQVRGRRIKPPGPWLALVQLTASMTNWALMGAAMFLLLKEQVPFGTAMGVLLAASIVGVVTPIPAGLGVLEAVYLALLSGQVRQGAILGAVLAYRALYYLVPLAGGLALYLLLEKLPEDPAANPPLSAPPTSRTR